MHFLSKIFLSFFLSFFFSLQIFSEIPNVKGIQVCLLGTKSSLKKEKLSLKEFQEEYSKILRGHDLAITTYNAEDKKGCPPTLLGKLNPEDQKKIQAFLGKIQVIAAEGKITEGNQQVINGLYAFMMAHMDSFSGYKKIELNITKENGPQIIELDREKTNETGVFSLRIHNSNGNIQSDIFHSLDNINKKLLAQKALGVPLDFEMTFSTELSQQLIQYIDQEDTRISEEIIKKAGFKLSDKKEEKLPMSLLKKVASTILLIPEFNFNYSKHKKILLPRIVYDAKTKSKFVAYYKIKDNMIGITPSLESASIHEFHKIFFHEMGHYWWNNFFNEALKKKYAQFNWFYKKDKKYIPQNFKNEIHSSEENFKNKDITFINYHPRIKNLITKYSEKSVEENFSEEIAAYFLMHKTLEKNFPENYLFFKKNFNNQSYEGVNLFAQSDNQKISSENVKEIKKEKVDYDWDKRKKIEEIFKKADYFLEFRKEKKELFRTMVISLGRFSPEFKKEIKILCENNELKYNINDVENYSHQELLNIEKQQCNEKEIIFRSNINGNDYPMISYRNKKMKLMFNNSEKSHRFIHEIKVNSDIYRDEIEYQIKKDLKDLKIEDTGDTIIFLSKFFSSEKKILHFDIESVVLGTRKSELFSLYGILSLTSLDYLNKEYSNYSTEFNPTIKNHNGYLLKEKTIEFYPKTFIPFKKQDMNFSFIFKSSDRIEKEIIRKKHVRNNRFSNFVYDYYKKIVLTPKPNHIKFFDEKNKIDFLFRPIMREGEGYGYSSRTVLLGEGDDAVVLENNGILDRLTKYNEIPIIKNYDLNRRMSNIKDAVKKFKNEKNILLNISNKKKDEVISVTYKKNFYKKRYEFNELYWSDYFTPGELYFVISNSYNFRNYLIKKKVQIIPR